jgi:hypothetical protein
MAQRLHRRMQVAANATPTIRMVWNPTHGPADKRIMAELE